ncbi:deoxyguanosinetriphosphate triphosphohydrolase [Anaerotignum neopropionicum]|uniref:Deoxyguanosinetriphosphate triphosphohydrolase n=1 Tax=Anaerotignum neopropionicum TaxID=36847 RepID=A0A136WH39_9FIRM|nr:dGTPase [Anaerotignum neopropionicum]KXL53886.1 deoxyguanosinetriphosphate triphosphohydrolase [Anaerotignum neopropionicum]
MEYDYKSKLCTLRMRNSTVNRSSIVDEFYSDRSRIIYSSSFRRLQQKAQVFSLEPNSSVRTRLTHSIEVSDLGRTLANKIGYKLYEAKIIEESMVPMIVAVVENACLLHDIGNPPFGHFGEAAIQEWARTYLGELADKAQVQTNDLFNLLISDFREFDGNPQGFRIISKLHCEQDEHSLNLTYATLLCGLKYSRASGEEKGAGIFKKAGYFQSEKEHVEKIYKDMGMEKHHRYPLTYIMEAADDIAYCLSDISDGIEKRIITSNDFLNEFKKIWKEEYKGIPCPVDIPESISNFSMDVSVKWSRKIINEAADNYIENHDLFYNGKAYQLIPEDGLGRVLEIIKQVSRKLLYKSDEAENIELTGYAVITGLLNHFSRLLSLKLEDFTSLINDNKAQSGNTLDLEKRLFNRLGERYVKSYIYETRKLDRTDPEFVVKEWWLRTHLIIDHINGMTDDFALDTYQMLTGIKTNVY